MVQSLDQTEHCDRLRRFRHLVQPGACSGWSPPGVALAYPADDAARRRAHQSAGVGPRHTPDSGLERRAARARRAMELKPPAKRAASPSIGKACSPWWLATAACALSWRQARREWVITVSRTQPLGPSVSPQFLRTRCCHLAEQRDWAARPKRIVFHSEGRLDRLHPLQYLVAFKESTTKLCGRNELAPAYGPVSVGRQGREASASNRDLGRLLAFVRSIRCVSEFPRPAVRAPESSDNYGMLVCL